MSDDFGSTPATSGQLTVGGALQGKFESPFDTDLFSLTLKAGTTYLLGVSQLTMPYIGTSYSPMTLLLEGADGSVLDMASVPEAAQFGSNAQLPVIQFTPKADGAYFLLARADTGNLGSYTLSAAVQVPDDVASDPSTMATLAPGGSAHATFEVAGDHDWFKFHADAGQHYSFSYSLAEAGTVAPSQFRLYDHAGQELQSWSYPFEPSTSGDYFLSAEGMQPGAYVVTEKLVLDDYSSNDSSPGRLPVNGTVSGSLEYQGDTDNFKINVTNGVSYAIELLGDPQDQRYFSVLILDSNGQQIAVPSYTAASGALHLTLTAAMAGAYSVVVSGRSNIGGLVTHSPYTLSASAASNDDYGATPATAGAMSVGTTVHGTLQSSHDVDMFQPLLQAGTAYTFSLMPDDPLLPGSSFRVLRVSDANGQVLASSTFADPGQLTFTPTFTGSYYLSALDSNLDAAPMAYALASALAPDDVGANAAHAGVLPIGASAAGNLETYGDRDWFAVNLTADSTYWFTLAGYPDQGNTLSMGADAVLRLIDAQGNEYASVHGVYSAAQNPLAFAPSSSATYYVEVASPHALGTYQLSAQVGAKDDYGNDTAHATALQLGTGITGTLAPPNDKDVFQLLVTAGTAYNLLLDRADGKGFWQGPNPQASDVTGQPIALYVQNSGDINFSFTAASSGPVYVTLGTDGINGSAAGPYHLLASALGVDDFPGDSSTTAVLPPDGQLHGTLNTLNDSDWIKVHMEAGKDYRFDLLGSAAGAVLLLHGPSGAFMFGHGGGAWQTHLRAQATASGDYYLEVQNGFDALSRTGSYTLSMTSAFDDQRDPQLQSSSIVAGAVGIPLNSTLVLTYSEPIALGWSSWALKEAHGDFPGFTQLDQTRLQVGTGVLNNTVSIDLTGLLRSGSSYALDLSYAGVMDLAEHGNQSGNILTFTTKFNAPPAAPQIGTAGNDVLPGSGNGSTLKGGDGIDTATFGFSRTDYVINRVNEQLIVQLNDTSVGDQLDGVERLEFSNAQVAVDINGHGGQAYRMYQAAFNRTPDSAGVGYWISVLDQGASLGNVASSFVVSAEFVSKYGSAPSDAQFVDLLYQNVLHRSGDQPGVDYWLQALHNGMSRAEGLLNFSEAAENQAGVLPLIANGFVYTPWH